MSPRGETCSQGTGVSRLCSWCKRRGLEGQPRPSEGSLAGRAAVPGGGPRLGWPPPPLPACRVPFAVGGCAPGGTGFGGLAGWWAPGGSPPGPAPGMGSVCCVHSSACLAGGLFMAGRRPGGGDSAAPPSAWHQARSLLTGLLTFAPLKAYLRTFGSLAIFNIKIKAFLHMCGLKNRSVSPRSRVLAGAAGGSPTAPHLPE